MWLAMSEVATAISTSVVFRVCPILSRFAANKTQQGGNNWRGNNAVPLR